MQLKSFTNPKPIPANTSPVRDSLSQSEFDLLVAQYKRAVYERSARQNSFIPSALRTK